MRTLPLVVSLVVAGAIAAPLTRALRASPLARTNYAGKRIAAPLGLLILAAALPTLALVGGWTPLALFATGIGVLGLVDDAAPSAARGVRSHLRAALAGRPDSGMLKAVGTAVLALATVRWLGLSGARAPLATGVLVLAPHAFNLLDLRPGRAIKFFVLLVAVLLLAARTLRPLVALGAFIGPLAVVAIYDLRERGMLGDSGASLLGALAGLLAVLMLTTPGLAIALVALAGLALYGELRSISVLIENVPLLRSLDSIGRPA